MFCDIKQNWEELSKVGFLSNLIMQDRGSYSHFVILSDSAWFETTIGKWEFYQNVFYMTKTDKHIEGYLVAIEKYMIPVYWPFRFYFFFLLHLCICVWFVWTMWIAICLIYFTCKCMFTACLRNYKYHLDLISPHVAIDRKYAPNFVLWLINIKQVSR